MTPPDKQNLENLYEEAIKAIRDNRRAEAIPYLEQMLQLTPDDAHALNLYGECLGVCKRHEEAATALKKSIALEPYNGEAWGKLGGAYGFLGEWDLSRMCYDNALKYAPDMPAAHWNRSLNRLLNGDFEEGWKEYQWGQAHGTRRRRTQEPESLNISFPPRSLYIWAEQGMGDTIQFVQLLALIRKHIPNTRLVLEVHRELIPLLIDQPFLEGVTIVGYTDWDGFPVECEAHCGLMSLPHYLGLELEDLPAATNYLQAPNPAEKYPGELEVGICWKGNPKHGNTLNRDVPEEAIRLLAGVEGVTPYCLQKGAEAPLPFNMVTPALNSWADTANVIASLDLVITADTGVAHLSAAMGKETWILVPFVHDWRWLRDRTDCPWYPSVRLFRQEKRGDWEGVITAVREALAQRAGRVESIMPSSKWHTLQTTNPTLAEYGVRLRGEYQWQEVPE